jgi:hypothetical protein
MAVTESRLRDGVLRLGTAPNDIDFSCQVTNARINSSYDDDGDSQETLCGDQIAAGRKLSGRSLAGTFIQDWTADPSITDYCYDHDLETLAFEYTPNTVDGTKPVLTGSLRIEVPAETYGGDVNTRVTSDFEWQLTAPLTRTPGTAPAATGATAGTPGTWTPGGSTPPSSVANLIAGTPVTVTASPATAWTTGQYVQTGTAGAAGEAHWSGTAWVAGRA